ncbi:putative MFS multidrug resistance transporter [Xylona heveae TC161]|uniref:Putative MFS multidrug resistance transporter n=1 Tax=Xylona heveae (strain CBS 132557 / TC161) TaxID=1328760 RepID=A0A164ZEN6_XYLHT|nr:putative MFS multidrug resistance transporter [Xylona heveae TC161]KZF19007.1 putative MFS multidrug resistance transporter [Xylona heveae TC161]
MNPITSSPHTEKDSETDISRVPSVKSEAARGDKIRPQVSQGATSRKSRAESVVPRGNRRGLFGRFALLPEVAEPQLDYVRKEKWAITFIISMAAVAAPLGSTIFFPSLPELSKDFHTSPTTANLSVAFYMLSMSIFPLWWSSFSESLGRRTVYLISFCLFLLWSILSAVSTSIAMLIVMRALAGGASASVQAVGAGTIADIWEVRERGKAMGTFFLGPLCGPLFAPIIGGALAQRWGWRSTQWFLAIYGGLLVLALFFGLPETLKHTKPFLQGDSPSPTTSPPPHGANVETESKSADTFAKQPSSSSTPRPDLQRTITTRSVILRKRTTTIILALKRILLDPLRIILYLRFPVVLITVYYASITFGSLYILNISVQHTFSAAPYHFRTIIVGLLYIPNSLGYFIASFLGGRWTDTIMHREARRAGRYDEDGKLILLPEDRMRENVWVAAALYPAALVWYGWSAQEGVFWFVPMLANFFFGIGTMLVFGTVTTMLTEFMPKTSSAGVAVNNFIRNIFSAVGVVVAQPLLDAIGNGWLFTALGIIAALSSAVIWAMKRFGPRWRDDMARRMG